MPKDYNEMIIRQAAKDDAETIAQLLLASISMACKQYAPYKDQTVLKAWCENKTPSYITDWIENPDIELLVAEEHDVILGVGLITHNGAIKLCYTRPGYTRRGVGKAIVDYLESYAIDNKLETIVLYSTVNAVTFYEHLGFEVTGEPIFHKGVIKALPMEKKLCSSS
jgi:GNAT superfamily N-acetyltransferase